jgi:hypothetical protein
VSGTSFASPLTAGTAASRGPRSERDGGADPRTLLTGVDSIPPRRRHGDRRPPERGAVANAAAAAAHLEAAAPAAPAGPPLGARLGQPAVSFRMSCPRP